MNYNAEINYVEIEDSEFPGFANVVIAKTVLRDSSASPCPPRNDKGQGLHWLRSRRRRNHSMAKKANPTRMASAQLSTRPYCSQASVEA